MIQTQDRQEILRLIKILSPQAMPRLEYISRKDLKLTDVHQGGIKENVPLTTDMRYPRPDAFPLGAENAHGEIEMIGDVEATHWYAKADGVTWHFVTTGDPSNEPFVLLHGFPESWYTFHNQMRDLSDQFYCISIDVIGHGQSDKRLDLDYRYSAIAKALAKLPDTLGVGRFNLGGHDRGAVISDHILNVEGMEGRVLRYVRMQQSANEPHGDPKPPHKVFAKPWFPKLMKWTGFPRLAYAASAYRVKDISPEVLTRIGYECKYEGIAEASPRQFDHTSMEQELEDRHNFLFAKMTMPVLFLQGRFDP
ncbi:MAG: alpha/beta hydrolase, partial [Chloroflexota bacterium]